MNAVEDPSGITICHIIDVGPKHPNTGEPTTPENWPTLKEAIETSKMNIDLIFYATRYFKQFVSNKSNAFYLPQFADTNIYFPHSLYSKSIDVGIVCKDIFLKRKNFLNVCSTITDFKVQRKQNIYFHDQAAFYRQCKIVLNDSQFMEVGTRLYEASACGACVVQEYVKDIEELFIENKEMVFYRDLKDMISKVNWLLAHPKTMQKIATAGMKHTHSDHSLRIRAKFIYDKLEQITKHGKANIC